jgi:hypothetical protein
VRRDRRRSKNRFDLILRRIIAGIERTYVGSALW